MTTTLQLLQYYSSLLIKQYAGQPKAVATIQASIRGVIMPQVSTQQISYSVTPTSGSYVLSYNGSNTISLNFNATDLDIQNALQSLPGLSSVTVSGLLVTFTGVESPALSLIVFSNSLQAAGQPVAITITETDLTLPLAVQNGFNLIGSQPAQGVQLDILGKYAGVTRIGTSTTGSVITLDDTDFLTLIQMKIITNSAGSSLSDINNLLFQFFGTQILCVDNANMSLTYFVSSLVSSDLIEVFITEKLLPAPMGVNVSVIVFAPIVNAFFGFITYDNPVQPMVTRPFNNYDDYQTVWPWFTYSYVL